MRKEIGKGVLMGIAVPLAFMSILYVVFLLFEKKMPIDVIMSGLLFGVGLNALLVRFYFKKNKDYRGRGILLACFVICIVWVLKFIL